ncbi:tRNA guanosine(15) transglycosylase TgtA [Candidatus Bathyarchaeota archaeon]|nr:tRNA guanosine(15) transglycosylase TgtA [Candidatus Bathyarchaeota archaeon]
MTFEVKERDLLARIGRLKTKSGTVETPLLFPVINPAVQPVPPRRIREEFGFDALITNAYILKKRFQNQPAEKGLHRFLDFNGVIMTDSGAYQILVYGDIETTPKEIVEYQEQIDTDIATMLDYPTGWKVSRKHAEKTVNTTVERAKELFKTKTRDDILWVGPVQGGQYLDLVAKSATEMRKLPFQIHALGSPTAVMEQYRFDVLVDMIMAAKMNLPVERPLHVFGAGHPFMFVLAVALGCDLFDSAAYAIYARENRYMTEYGTSRLKELEYFPCTCPRCSKTTPKEVLEMPKEDREAFLAEHNLYACLSELRRIKQAIKNGRLWEHLELRAHGHPALLQALKRLKNYEDYIEKHSPTTKKSGIFFFNSIGLIRPEVVRHRKKLAERYTPSPEAKILLLIPQTQTKPYHKSKEFKEVAKLLRTRFKNHLNEVHACFYVAPFGIVPTELDEVYPLSQHETALPLDRETIEYVATQTADYINHTNYNTVLLLHSPENWHNTVLNICRKTCLRKNIKFNYLNAKQKQNKPMLNRLEKVLRRILSEQP